MSDEAIKKIYEANAFPRWGSLSSIRKLVGRKKTVLDVGCASGYLGELLMENGNILYGVDGNSRAIEIAKKKYHEALCVDLNSAHDFFKEIKFDVIVFADVLEHLSDPETVLQNCEKLLKSDGRIIVSLPNVALWRVRFNLLFGRFDYTDYGVLDKTHLHFYTFKTAMELVQKTGFTILSLRGALNFWPFGILIDLFPFLKSLLSIHIIIEAKKKA